MQTTNTITAEAAKMHLEDLLLGASQGEAWLITDSTGHPMAKLTPPEQTPTTTSERWLAFGLMKGIVIKPDFDEPLEEFEPYM